MHDGDEFGESVTYTPLSTGTPAAYSAVIDRLGVQPYGENPDAVSELFRVSLPYDSTGLSGPSVVQAGDAVALAKRQGQAPFVVRVMSWEESDAGVWVLSCR
jgi:hypothetical protein